MSYAAAKAALDALSPQADKLAYALATVYQWNDGYYVTYRALIDILSVPNTTQGKDKTDAIRGFVQMADPTGLYDALLLQSGQEGGAQLSRGDVQTLLSAAVAAQVISQADADKINAKARSSLGPRYSAEWGLQTFDADTLTRLPLLVKHEQLTGLIDATLAVIGTYPDVLAAVAGFTVTPTHRAALVSYAQDFKALILADNPAAATYDATLAGAWAMATEGAA